jgi:hypothetical protein
VTAAASAETGTTLFGGKVAMARLVEVAVVRHSVMVASEPVETRAVGKTATAGSAEAVMV